MLKKTSSIILLLLTVGVLTTTYFTSSPVLSKVHTSSKSKKVTNSMIFKFENYEQSEDAHKKLLELFPIGSDVSKFTKAMKSLEGTLCIEDPGLIGCQYSTPVSSATGYSWYVSTYFSTGGKITKIEVQKNPSAI
jgi:hypothetical protein